MKKSILHASIMALVFIQFLTGCAPVVGPTQKPGGLDRELLIQQMETRAARWQSYEAAIRISAEGPRGKYALRGLILAQLPDNLRMELYTPFGQAVGILTMNAGRSVLLNPAEKKAYTAKNPTVLFNRVLGYPLPPDIFGYALVACIPPSRLAQLTTSPSSTGMTASLQDALSRASISWNFKGSPPALAGAQAAQGSATEEIVYLPPVPLDPGALPGELTFSSGKWHMTVSIKEVKAQQGFPESSFVLKVPEGIELVDLES